VPVVVIIVFPVTDVGAEDTHEVPLDVSTLPEAPDEVNPVPPEVIANDVDNPAAVPPILRLATAVVDITVNGAVPVAVNDNDMKDGDADVLISCGVLNVIVFPDAVAVTPLALLYVIEPNVGIAEPVVPMILFMAAEAAVLALTATVYARLAAVLALNAAVLALLAAVLALLAVVLALLAIVLALTAVVYARLAAVLALLAVVLALLAIVLALLAAVLALTAAVLALLAILYARLAAT